MATQTTETLLRLYKKSLLSSFAFKKKMNYELTRSVRMTVLETDALLCLHHIEWYLLHKQSEFSQPFPVIFWIPAHEWKSEQHLPHREHTALSNRLRNIIYWYNFTQNKRLFPLLHLFRHQPVFSEPDRNGNSCETNSFPDELARDQHPSPDSPVDQERS